MIRWSGSILALAATAALLSPGSVQADPDETIPCVRLLIKAPPAGGGNGLTRFVCRGTFTLPSPAAVGFVTVDANLDPPGTLAAAVGGFCSGLGSPPGSRGYKCGDASATVLIKTNVIRGYIQEDFPGFFHGHPHPFSPDVVRLRVRTSGSSDTKNYCARFTSPSTNSATLYRSTTAPAPSACSPSGAFLAQDGGLF